MSRYTAAVADIRFIAARFRGFLEAAQALEELGSVETAIDESRNRLAQLADEETQAKLRAGDIIAGATEDAARIRSEAHADASAKSRAGAQTLDDARATASEIVDAAKARADAIVAQADALAEAHAGKKAQLASLDEMIAARHAEHDQVQAKIADAVSEHARVLAIIAEAKAKF